MHFARYLTENGTRCATKVYQRHNPVTMLLHMLCLHSYVLSCVQMQLYMLNNLVTLAKTHLPSILGCLKLGSKTMSQFGNIFCPLCETFSRGLWWLDSQCHSLVILKL